MSIKSKFFFFCNFCLDRKKFISEKGKIIPSRVSGICKRNQKYLTTAIKQARVCGLLHFSNSKYDPFINDEPSTVLDLDFY